TGRCSKRADDAERRQGGLARSLRASSDAAIKRSPFDDPIAHALALPPSLDHLKMQSVVATGSRAFLVWEMTMGDKVPQPALAIGALSAQTGVNIETIRFYEKAGLLPPPPRSPGGFRLYDRDHLRRLTFIRRARELGFTLDEVR